MADGYDGIWTPYNTDEFEAVVEDIRRHFNGNSARLVTMGVDLRRELPRAINVHGRRGLLGADLQLAAWQINRQCAQAAASQTASAAAIGRAHQIFVGTFGGRRTQTPRGRFNAA